MILKKPTIAFQPIKSDKFDQKLPNSVSYRIFEVEELLNIVDSIMKDSIQNSSCYISNQVERQSVLENHIHLPLNVDSCDLILDEIDEYSFNSDPKDTKFKKTSCFIVLLKRIKEKIVELDRKRKGQSPIKFSFTSKSEIKRDINILKEILNLKNDINVQQLDINLFLFRNKKL
jgi:hypothetical protein